MNSNKNRVFEIGGYNVSSFVKSINGLMSMQKKPEWGSMPETPRLELELINVDNVFSPSSGLSIFHGEEIKTFSIEVFYKQGSTAIMEWSGSIETLEVDWETKTVRIVGISPFSRLLDSPALTILDSDTPAELSRQIFELYYIEYDVASFSYADFLQNGLISVTLDPNLLDSQITLMEVQKQLATAGYGRIYPYNNKMYYDVFDTNRTYEITVELDDRDIMTHPKESRIEHDKTAYQVTYIQGTAESELWTSTGESQNLDFGVNSCVKIQTLTGATQVADQWELISGLKKHVLEFGIKHVLGYMLELGSIITLTWKTGSIENVAYEITGIDRTDPRFCMIEIQSL